MAKLQIAGGGIHPGEVSVYLDGVRIEKLVSLELTIAHDDANRCRIAFYLTDIEVDAEVLVELQAKIKN